MRLRTPSLCAVLFLAPFFHSSLCSRDPASEIWPHAAIVTRSKRDACSHGGSRPERPCTCMQWLKAGARSASREGRENKGSCMLLNNCRICSAVLCCGQPLRKPLSRSERADARENPFWTLGTWAHHSVAGTTARKTPIR